MDYNAQKSRISDWLDEGWDEVTATQDKITNTAVLKAQALAAEKAVTKVGATFIELGKDKAVLSSILVSLEIEDILARNSLTAGFLGLSACLSARLAKVQDLCDKGIEEESFLAVIDGPATTATS